MRARELGVNSRVQTGGSVFNHGQLGNKRLPHAIPAHPVVISTSAIDPTATLKRYLVRVTWLPIYTGVNTVQVLKTIRIFFNPTP
eukprot:m.40638 g.40638  ORF g.40638 m.40638 type:complete len:85 (+) comp18554_c0_seq1:182-436(+)